MATEPVTGNDPGRGGRWRINRRAAAAGSLAVVFVTGAIIAALLPKGDAGQHALAATSTSPRTTASPRSASPSPALGSCLLGAWQVVTEDTTVEINSKPVTFIGHGATQTFRPDGTSVSDYGKGIEYAPAAPVNGARLSIVVNGQATLRYETENGLLTASHLTAHGNVTVYQNGAYNQAVPLSQGQDMSPARFTCSADTLRLTYTDGKDSLDLKRMA